MLFSEKVPRLVINCRYWLALMVLFVATVTVLYTRRPSIFSYLIGFIAFAPILFLLLQLLNKRATSILLSLPILIVGGIAIGLLAVLSQGLATMHNGYPVPLLMVSFIWWLAAIAFVIAPTRRYSVDMVTDSSKNYARSLSVMIVPALVLVWIAFTQFVIYKAQMVASEDSWCIRETDKTHLRSTLWLSPRKMFHENNYKGGISPYLLLKVGGDSWSHHWSFAAMNFVQNETNAFLGSLSFFKTNQIQKPC